MSFMRAMHRCKAPGCVARVARRHLFCIAHYALVPGWLQQRLSHARDYGIAWKCHPTQEYVDLRDMAVRMVTNELARRHRRAPGEQLPLLPAT